MLDLKSYVFFYGHKASEKANLSPLFEGLERQVAEDHHVVSTDNDGI